VRERTVIKFDITLDGKVYFQTSQRFQNRSCDVKLLPTSHEGNFTQPLPELDAEND
jgi:hypothetical protein